MIALPSMTVETRSKGAAPSMAVMPTTSKPTLNIMSYFGNKNAAVATPKLRTSVCAVYTRVTKLL